MATDQDFVDYVAEQVGVGNRLTRRKMFGEYALYANQKVVALVCDNMLYLKPTEPGRALLEEMSQVNEQAPFPGAKMWFSIDAELDNPERLGELLRVTERAVPAPKEKRKPRA